MNGASNMKVRTLNQKKMGLGNGLRGEIIKQIIINQCLLVF